MNKIDIKSFTRDELAKLFLNLDEKSYRGKQVYKWIHQKLVEDIDQITVLSKSLRDKLNEEYKIGNARILEKYVSKIDGTRKYLFLLEDKNIIESVMMQYKYGVSLCLSTQVGCKMGCSFCASTKDGFIRNLTSSEILDQVYKIKKDIGKDISNIVLMGSGEPLDNYENIMSFLNIIHSQDGQNIGYRHITLSTCGIVPQIYDLADEDLSITLSISLHTPFDEKRKSIMPIANKYSVSEIIKACKYYVKKTNRRITFEYTLIHGFNDRLEDVKELVKITRGLLCHINIIRLNPIEESSFTESKENNLNKFKKYLMDQGIGVTVRRRMGEDIEGACGQLRRDYLKSKINNK